MDDQLTPQRRSWLMSRVKGKNTQPELVVRSLLFARGFRFRVHRKDLPGRPDVVLPKYRTVIFVHGCFWHRHPRCRKTTMPATRTQFWSDKFAQNIERDRSNQARLETMGWRSIVVWECEIASGKELADRLVRELESLTDKVPNAKGG